MKWTLPLSALLCLANCQTNVTNPAYVHYSLIGQAPPEFQWVPKVVPQTLAAIPLPNGGSNGAVNSKVLASKPRNLIYAAYAYYNQWNTDTTAGLTPIDITTLASQGTGVQAVLISPCNVDATNPNVPTLMGHPLNSDYWKPIWPQYQKLQASGVKLIASFGGYGSSTFYLLNQDWNKYYPPLVAFLKAQRFDGIDIDIEPAFNPSGWLPDGITLPLKIAQSIRRDMGANFILTFAPVARDLETDSKGYSGFSYIALDKAAVNYSGGQIVKTINWYNAQFYNGFGSSNSPIAYEQIVTMGQWDPSRVVLGVVTTSAEGSGWSTLSTLQNTARQLRQKYSNFGGVIGYEYARAGTSDNLSQQWQWSKGINTALTS